MTDGKSENKKKSTNKFSKRIKKNPWIPAVIVLAVVLILVLGTGFSFSNVSEDKAAKGFVEFINEEGQANVEYVSSQEYGSNLYQVTVDSNGQKVPVYITKDGKYFVQIISPISDTKENPGSNTNTNAQSDTQNVPKADVPEVELFIWSYCPYGVTAQEPLATVQDLLGDYAEFRPVMYYAGHGEYELQQNKIQECIRDNYEEGVYWNYAEKFVSEIYPICSSSRDVGCDLENSIELMNDLGIDSEEVLSCVEEQGDELYQADYDYAKELGVTGSPSLVINGVKVNSARNAEAYKTVVCQAFTEGNAPSECDEVLSTSGSTASGNC